MGFLIVLCSLLAGCGGYLSMWSYYSRTPAESVGSIFLEYGVGSFVFALSQWLLYRHRAYRKNNIRRYQPWLMFMVTVGIYLSTTLSGYNFYNHVSIELGNLMAYFGLALGLIFLSIQINLLLPEAFGSEC